MRKSTTYPLTAHQRLVDAVRERNALEERIKQAAVEAHTVEKVPLEEVSRLVGKHRNTVRSWCEELRERTDIVEVVSVDVDVLRQAGVGAEVLQMIRAHAK